MSLVAGPPLDEIREAGVEPGVQVWMTPFGFAAEVNGKWVILEGVRSPRDISEHPDVEVSE